MTIVINTPEGIAAARLLALRGALTLETKGFRRRGRSVYSIVKREFGFRGSKQRVLEQLVQFINDRLNIIEESR